MCLRVIRVINKLPPFITFAFLCFCAPLSHGGQCLAPEVTLISFNGVQNTPALAIKNAILEKKAFSNATPKVRLSKARVAYNDTQILGTDFHETFVQRVAEGYQDIDDHYELIWAILAHGSNDWLDSSIKFSKAFLDLNVLNFKSTLDYTISLIPMGVNPNTSAVYQRHNKAVGEEVAAKRKVFMVAHSQGNLFANQAFEYGHGLGVPNAISILHIAPASVKVNGEYVLADKDMVINSLPGKTMPPNFTIPPAKDRPAPMDPMGHGLSEIYLNANLTIAEFVKENGVKELEKLNRCEEPVEGKGEPLPFLMMCDSLSCLPETITAKDVSRDPVMGEAMMRWLLPHARECKSITKMVNLQGRYYPKSATEGVYKFSCSHRLGNQLGAWETPVKIQVALSKARSSRK